MAAGTDIETAGGDPCAAAGDPTGETLRVRLWRFEQLVARGFQWSDAQMLAGDPRVDLASARSLVARGCPPALAVRILA